ncbi:MAG TPA: isocitrate lyase/PEP mutase family protein [Selenomonadales bacterium]|nr:isocitrate lyase/PEP mutase family protein [Selenomonadales bacterium]
MKNQKLRRLLAAPELIVAPGAYDAWSARLVEFSGFPVIYMTGYGVSASTLGQPDIGLITMSEMIAQVRNISACTSIPLIADGDTGYGGILNVVRTVAEYETAGASAIQLEDQLFPKRCGHMEGKQLIPQAEMISKIKAAVHARKDPDFVIIARTDARAVEGFPSALSRAQAYADAGADVIFFEAPQSVDEMRDVAKTIAKPLLANMVEKGKTPLLTGKELTALGFKIAIYPVSALYAATKNVLALLASLKEQDTTAGFADGMVSFPQFNELVGVDKARALESSFVEGDEKRQ